MSAPQNTRLGITLMIVTSAIFALQDGISRHLGEAVNIYMVVMIRFWFMSAFVIAIAARSAGGIRGAVQSHYPWLQGLRAFLLVAEIGVMVVAFIHLGLIETHAVFVVYPLLVTLFSGPILGEKVGWRRWLAVLVGFGGVLVILNPGGGIFSIWALLPLTAAAMFALYGLLTRYVSRQDSAATSFFWTGVGGAVFTTPLGLYHWQSMSGSDWGLMLVLCVAAVVSHGLLIKAYDVAEAADIQPFAYFQLPFVSILGLVLFQENLRINVVIGAVIVVAAGLFTLWRQRMRAKAAKAG
ncbi:DMT family transporter [Xinfangfangia sp. D13-10-4-6]|uniref:DMT family transporter n=1 Tax=Pseudogemmobacter hezensis TaxID=2737662 RepID=UPI001553A639|nr:DMT family transporter [Pseudogemmobacter hezensis]NPD13892.1 DMT family transporter [Pseudogemmobacter hezensis]